MQRPRFALTVSLVFVLTILGAIVHPSAKASTPSSLLGLTLPKPPAGDPPNGRIAGGGVRFSPPPIPLGDGPGGRPRGGASRDACPRSPIPLTALVPWAQRAAQEQPPIYDVWGLTTAARPTFWFYIPYAKKTDYSAVFILQDEAENDVYRGDVPLPDAPGVVSAFVPPTATALEAGKTYRWYLYFYCDKKKTPPPVFVEGLIQRVNADAKLTNQLANATPLEQVKLYAEKGIWFNALTTLAELRHANPNDPALKADWQSLLQAIEVEAAVINAPIQK